MYSVAIHSMKALDIPQLPSEIDHSRTTDKDVLRPQQFTLDEREEDESRTPVKRIQLGIVIELRSIGICHRSAIHSPACAVVIRYRHDL